MVNFEHVNVDWDATVTFAKSVLNVNFSKTRKTLFWTLKTGFFPILLTKSILRPYVVVT